MIYSRRLIDKKYSLLSAILTLPVWLFPTVAWASTVAPAAILEFVALVGAGILVLLVLVIAPILTFKSFDMPRTWGALFLASAGVLAGMGVIFAAGAHTVKECMLGHISVFRVGVLTLLPMAFSATLIWLSVLRLSSAVPSLKQWRRRRLLAWLVPFAVWVRLCGILFLFGLVF